MARNTSLPLDVEHPLGGDATRRLVQPIGDQGLSDTDPAAQGFLPSGDGNGFMKGFASSHGPHFHQFSDVVNQNIDGDDIKTLMQPADMSEKVVNKALGERVKRAREAAGLTQLQLAAAIGSEGKQSAIAEIEAGRVRRPKRLHEIAQATNTTMEWLLGVLEPRRPKTKPPQNEHIDSEDIAATLDHDGESIRQAEPPFEGAIAQITGYMGGGSTGEVIALDTGEMQTIEPVAAWWKIPGEALSGFGFRNIMPAHIVGWLMDGASMEPTIQRTDVVFIDTRRRAPDPEGIFAVDYGEGRTLKRIRVLRTPEGVKLELRSDNAERFSPVTCGPDEVTIFGRYLFRFTVF